jgi:hypothetical protein
MFINISNINKIIVNKDSYYIHFGSNNNSCFNFLIQLAFDKIPLTNDTIKICKNENYADYIVMTDWLSKL